MATMDKPKLILIQLRAPAALADALKDAAQLARRTRSAEALVRLERSFKDGEVRP